MRNVNEGLMRRVDGATPNMYVMITFIFPIQYDMYMVYV